MKVGLQGRTGIGARGLGITALVLVVAAACSDSPTDPPETDLWAGSIAGVEAHEEIAGSATLVVSPTAFSATVAIEGAEPESVLAWGVVHGTCEEPGELIGSADIYPALEIGADGEFTTSTTVSHSLQDTDDVHVSVWHEDGEDAVIVACGDVTPV